MTRKDFELIAAAIRRELDDAQNRTAEQRGLELAAHSIGSAIKKVNPRFEHGRFLRACGVA